MIVREKKSLCIGMALGLTFAGVLVLLFSPVVGGKTGLQFADDSFNSLAKGSSYFIPDVSKSAEGFVGKSLAVKIELESPEGAEGAKKLFDAVPVTATVEGREIEISGDLGAILRSALQDADHMFGNDGEAVSRRYGYGERKVMENWWHAFGGIARRLKKDRRVAEAHAVEEVIEKAIEPSHNFYEIPAQRARDHVAMLAGLLLFYVVYTMWWGYAIYYIFDGVGLGVTSAKAAK